ncbi:MAG: RNA methyltransferase [Desulfotignum sp.]|nr:RNA methyltransferase [Desulfobacteraceae bacterium]
MDNLYLALVHFPVVNRKNEPIGSALTTIDLHDIARACMTFGVNGFYVVTPYQDQAKLADQVIRHWLHGEGGRQNPSRKQALERVRVTDTIETATNQIQKERNQPVVTIATSAKKHNNTISTRQLRQRLCSNTSHVLIFGTAWGLAQELMDNCDMQLDPITGTGDYNHLSVRSAASIYLDRLTNGRDSAER